MIERVQQDCYDADVAWRLAVERRLLDNGLIALSKRGEAAWAMETKPTEKEKHRDIVGNIISAFDDPVTRLYCRIRFRILHQRFLDEIGQYLPPAGRVFDIGCGFGLFSLYYATRFPCLEIHGKDLNRRRVNLACGAATRLGLSNVHYDVGDARCLTYERDLDGAYMLDIIHHIPQSTVPRLIQEIYGKLRPDGRLVIKDVETRPFYKLWFTYLLDVLVDGRSELHYWSREEMIPLLRETGFEVACHSLVDILPYPHILYICRKTGARNG